MTTWLMDLRGNKCSVEWFGTKNAAQQALDSLENCDNCTNCTNCSRPDGGELKIGQTGRGFAYGKFKDRYGVECSLQKSSLATEDCIWLGIHENRMHLTQEMVAMLLPALTAFAETGDLVRTPTNESPASQAEASEHAPWSEDEEDAERLLACASRRKKYGDENCECDEDGSCVECEYDMQDVLKKRYAPLKHTTTPAPQPPVEGLRESLEIISGLSVSLRAGGPDYMDLQELSDALERACEVADTALAAIASPSLTAGDQKATSDLDVHAAIAEALTQACEYFEDRADVNDGDYGVPEPNTEMRLAQMCSNALDLQGPGKIDSEDHSTHEA